MTMVVITGRGRIRLVQHEQGPRAAADSSPDIIHESHQGGGIAAELLDFTSGWTVPGTLSVEPRVDWPTALQSPPE
jgi:hypothetical protein